MAGVETQLFQLDPRTRSFRELEPPAAAPQGPPPEEPLPAPAPRAGPRRPLRIVQFIRALYYGGTETQLLEILRGLRQEHDQRVGLFDPGGPLQRALGELGIRSQAFPPGGKFLHWGTLRQIHELARWLSQEKVDLVHVHDFAPTLTVVPAAKLAGCRVVVSRLDLAHYHSPAQRLVLAGLTHLADHVIANAEAIRAMLVREERLPAARVTVVRNGIDLPRFDQRRAQPLSAPLPDTHGAPVLLNVANMNHPVKRQEDLLLALALLRRHGQHAHAFLVGDGPRRPQLERLARELGVEAQAHFLGHRDDVPALHAHATVGVLCSSAEGLSNAVIEGMAAGLPMVVTQAGGNGELVTGERGLVIPVANAEALAQACLRVLKNPQWAAQAAARARAFVERELTVEAMTRQVGRVYRQVFQGTRRAPARPRAADQG